MIFIDLPLYLFSVPISSSPKSKVNEKRKHFPEGPLPARDFPIFIERTFNTGPKIVDFNWSIFEQQQLFSRRKKNLNDRRKDCFFCFSKNQMCSAKKRKWALALGEGWITFESKSSKIEKQCLRLYRFRKKRSSEF